MVTVRTLVSVYTIPRVTVIELVEGASVMTMFVGSVKVNVNVSKSVTKNVVKVSKVDSVVVV